MIDATHVVNIIIPALISGRFIKRSAFLSSRIKTSEERKLSTAKLYAIPIGIRTSSRMKANRRCFAALIFQPTLAMQGIRRVAEAIRCVPRNGKGRQYWPQSWDCSHTSHLFIFSLFASIASLKISRVFESLSNNQFGSPLLGSKWLK